MIDFQRNPPGIYLWEKHKKACDEDQQTINDLNHGRTFDRRCLTVGGCYLHFHFKSSIPMKIHTQKGRRTLRRRHAAG